MKRKAVLAIAIGVGALVGVAGGLGAFTFVYAEGGSYMTNEPSACANCHVMQQHYDAWSKSSHHAVATCNDCHAPHDFFGKYWTKARNGYNHSMAFTLGDFHEPIQITETNRRITESACRYCHQDMVRMIDPAHSSDEIACIRCHSSVGHMR